MHDFVSKICEAARRQRLEMSLTTHALIAMNPCASSISRTAHIELCGSKRLLIATDSDGTLASRLHHIFPASIFESPDFDRSRIEIWRRWTHSPTADRRLVVATADRSVVWFEHTGFCNEPDGGGATGRGELHGFYAHPDAWGTGAAPLLMASIVPSSGRPTRTAPGRSRLIRNGLAPECLSISRRRDCGRSLRATGSR